MGSHSSIRRRKVPYLSDSVPSQRLDPLYRFLNLIRRSIFRANNSRWSIFGECLSVDQCWTSAGTSTSTASCATRYMATASWASTVIPGKPWPIVSVRMASPVLSVSPGPILPRDWVGGQRQWASCVDRPNLGGIPGTWHQRGFAGKSIATLSLFFRW